ncbi:odorant receptor 4-like [Leptopilina boulardi]|uniref:odorant receptor 4-like n=1 Tax=Leptopilina boulardi TaxID=63433 RepID=UPI0021F5410C|nr:odorant receptor 4-like [Leptopilina boulardi]
MEGGKKEFDFLFRFCRYSLSWFGAWPEQKNKLKSTISIMIPNIFMSSVIIIPQGIRMYQVRHDIDLLSQIISTVELPVALAMSKMNVFYFNRKNITLLYDHMAKYWENHKSNIELEIMRKKGVMGLRMAYICLGMGHATMVARFTQCVFENLSSWSSPERYCNYSLFVDAYYPFTWNYTPRFESVAWTQITAIYFAMVAYSGSDSYYSQTVFHLCAEYNILRVKLTDLVNNYKVSNISNNEFYKTLGYIVENHVEINICIEHLESAFCAVFLIQLVSLTVQFCLQGFMLVLIIWEYFGKSQLGPGWVDPNFAQYLTEGHNSIIIDVMFIICFLIYMVGNFYIYCYLGEQLQMESFAFAQTAFDCEWYNLPPSKMRSMVFLIMSGRKPTELTAGKFCVLNLILFASIIKTSMGYLSFLVTMRAA